jgi:uncharacterized membrane protein YvbJ
MSNYFSGEEQSQASKINEKSLADKTIFEKINLYQNIIKDKIIIYIIERWIFVLVLLLVYLTRMFVTKGFYCLTYCIGIHFLNSFI